MPLILYKLVHLIGLIMAFAAVGVAVVDTGLAEKAWRKLSMILHGVGMFLLLLGGFGMLARLNIISGWPGWVWGKLAIWVLIGAAPVLIKRAPEKARPVLFGVMLLGAAAAYLALYKPF